MNEFELDVLLGTRISLIGLDCEFSMKSKMFRTMRVLLKRDAELITAFPRFEILSFLAMLIFLRLASVVLWPSLAVSEESVDLTVALSVSFKSGLMGSFLFIFVPVVVADAIAGEYERGILLTLVTYPVKRVEVLASKFVAVYLFCCSMLLVPTIVGTAVSIMSNGVTPKPVLIVTYIVSIMFFTLTLCSVSTLLSVASSRTVVAAIASIVILIMWPSLLGILSSPTGFEVYTYTGATDTLIDWLTFGRKPIGIDQKEITWMQVGPAVALQLMISASCLALAFLLFSRRDFK